MSDCAFCGDEAPDTPDYRVEGSRYCVVCIDVSRQLSEARVGCPGCRGADIPCVICRGRREVSKLTVERLNSTTIEDVI
jgi:hypothetical protein